MTELDTVEVTIAPQYLYTDADGNFCCSHCGRLSHLAKGCASTGRIDATKPNINGTPTTGRYITTGEPSVPAEAPPRGVVPDVWEPTS